MVKSRLRSRRSASLRSAVSSSPVALASIGRAVYPALAIVAMSACKSAAPRTLARSIARLTVASVTPGMAFIARSTRPTQDAQVIPSTANSTLADGTL